MENDIYLIRIAVQEIVRLLGLQAKPGPMPQPRPEPRPEPPTDPLEPWLSKQQVMDYLDIRSPSTYYRWIEEGLLVPRGGAGGDKFLKADLKALVEQRKKRKRRKAKRGNDGAARKADGSEADGSVSGTQG